MPLDQFGAYVAWTGNRYYFFGRACPADDAGPSTGVDKEFNTELDELVRRED